MCCKRLAEKYRTQKIAKICRLCSIAHTCRAVSSQLRHVSTIRKELVKQQYLFHMSSQYGELRLTSGWDRFGSFGHPSKFQRVSRLVFVTAATSFTGGQPNFARYLAVCRAATLYVHRVAKIVPPLGCYNFETYDRILIFFGRNVTNKVSTQKTYYYATANDLCFCTIWQNRENENRIFTQMQYYCIAWIQPAVWFLQSFWLTTHTHAAVWLPKSCNQCAQLGAVEGIVQEKGSCERYRSWTVLHAQCSSALSSGFPISQDNAEALERWGGKTKHRLTSYFLRNTFVKNYRNQIVCVKIIASQSGTFLRHGVHFRRILPPDGILPGAKFTLRPSLAYCYIVSVTARHSSMFRRGRHLYSAGRPSRWASAHILVLSVFSRNVREKQQPAVLCSSLF